MTGQVAQLSGSRPRIGSHRCAARSNRGSVCWVLTQPTRSAIPTASLLHLPAPSKPASSGRQPNAGQIHIGGDVQGRAVVAPAAVGGRLAGGKRAEVGAVGVEDVHAAGAGGEEVAGAVNLQA